MDFTSRAFLTWLVGFLTETEKVSKLRRLTPESILIKGEVFAVNDSFALSGSSDSDAGYQLSVRFQTPEGQFKEATRPAKASPSCQWFSVGDKVVVLFADDDNFWVL